MKNQCDMKGYLQFLILWLLNKKQLSGVKITKEIGKRKGTKPSPGTIYPALKELKKKGLIKEIKINNKTKIYQLSTKGKKELEKNCDIFCRTFYDLKDKISQFCVKFEKKNKG